MDTKFIEYDNKFDEIFSKLENNEIKPTVFYENQIFEAYEKIIEIFKTTKNEICIIDNYISDSILIMLSKVKVSINKIIITKCDNKKISELDIKKFNLEYGNLILERNNTYHDRYIIIDKKHYYILGSSIKDIGSKCTSIIKLSDICEINKLENKINNEL